MANSEIKQLFGASTELVLTSASLADGAGRSSALVDNETTRFGDLMIYAEVLTITAADADSTVDIYAIRSDDATANMTTDGVSADAAYTPVNAHKLGSLRLTSAGGVQTLNGEFHFPNPGPEFGIGIFNNTGQILSAVEGSCFFRYVGFNPEVQVA